MECGEPTLFKSRSSSAKRVAITTVDWALAGSKIHESQKMAFNALRGKVDKHLRIVNHLPESLPAIDFDAYKTRVAVPGMVDTFAKSYSGLQVPYPTDQGRIAEIDAQATESKASFNKFVSESNTRIAEFGVELAKWESMKPVEDMNMEEGLDAELPFIIDPAKKTAWPHTETWEAYDERLAASKPEDWGH